MSHWRAVLESEYPEMARALDAIGAMIGNRPVDVFEALVVGAAEAVRVRGVIRASFTDLQEAMQAYQESPAGPSEAAELAVRMTMNLVGAFQLGVWLGEGRLATLDPNRIRRRLATLDTAPRGAL